MTIVVIFKFLEAIYLNGDPQARRTRKEATRIDWLWHLACSILKSCDQVAIQSHAEFHAVEENSSLEQLLCTYL